MMINEIPFCLFRMGFFTDSQSISLSKHSSNVLRALNTRKAVKFRKMNTAN